jgi:hypothetical protein
MPIARSKADIMCLAVYTLAGGKLLQLALADDGGPRARPSRTE